jgi:2,4-dienoyl-CoA reductase-like NADH-dependent reductase (Old Yellow Enzyme family)
VSAPHYPRIATFKSAAALRAHCAALAIDLPCDDASAAAPDSPLAQPLDVAGARLANRFAIQPMEGWDGTEDGRPSPLTERRWRRFGGSGAALIWGGEAVAVQPEGRANPNQLLLDERTAASIGGLRRMLLAEAAASGAAPPLVGLQLTHSGRWSRPTAAGPAPRVAFRHPLLDHRLGIDDDRAVLSDGEVEALIGDFARAARLAQAEGFDFVDVKHCHGYLLHEFLAARARTGRFGGRDLGARTALLFALLDAVRAAAPGLAIAVRLSVFDLVPHRAGTDSVGAPDATALPYDAAFGLDPTAPERIDLTEPIAVVRALLARGVHLLNVTAASPYYAPHAQRPAMFPPSDGYQPPEDPLVGVARLLDAARRIKAAAPGAIVVSSGWGYLQDYLPHVAQATLRAGWFDAVGLGRVALSYPELPADVLAGRGLARKRVCRTFSDCTTAPRRGLVSGCYPLDPFYRARDFTR